MGVHDIRLQVLEYPANQPPFSEVRLGRQFQHSHPYACASEGRDERMFARSWLDHGNHLHLVTPPMVPLGKSQDNALEPAGVARGEDVKDRNRRVRHG